MLKRADASTASAELLIVRMQAEVDDLARGRQERDHLRVCQSCGGTKVRW